MNGSPRSCVFARLGILAVDLDDQRCLQALVLSPALTDTTQSATLEVSGSLCRTFEDSNEPAEAALLWDCCCDSDGHVQRSLRDTSQPVTRSGEMCPAPRDA